MSKRIKKLRKKKALIFVIFEKSGVITDKEPHLRAVTKPGARIFKVHEEAEAPDCPNMNFTREDYRGISYPHSDPLVQVVEIAEQPVY